MPAARIYRVLENAMQEGAANGRGWRLDYDVPYACRADPLTGWQGSGDVQGQVELRFPSLEAAVAYAEREGLDYRVEPAPKHTLKIQNYAQNFMTGPVHID
jgi:hypothetical protein